MKKIENNSLKTDNKIINLNVGKKEKKRRNRFKMVCAILVFAAIAAFLLSPFFNIKTIYVDGYNMVSKESIITKSGIQKGSNIFKINIKKTKESVKAISYVKDVHISRNIIKKDITVKITERKPIGFIKSGTGSCLIDNEGRILEFIDYIPQSLPEIAGIKIDKLKVGDYIDKKYELNIEAMRKLVSEFQSLDMFDRVSEINIKDSKNLTFMFDGNKKVVMGEDYRTDYKLTMLKSTIEELAPSEEGTIDLSTVGQALFTPSE